MYNAKTSAETLKMKPILEILDMKVESKIVEITLTN